VIDSPPPSGDDGRLARGDEMSDGRWGATALLVLVLGAGGCTSGGGGTDAADPEAPTTGSTTSEPTTGDPDASAGPAADEAAATYLKDLQRYQRHVARAARLTAAAFTNDSAPQYRAAQRTFGAALDSAPVLDAVDGADASEEYARTIEVAEHVQGFVDEHAWMTGWDRDESVRVYSLLYDIASDEYAQRQRLGAAYAKTMAGPGPTQVKMKRALRAEVAAQLRNAATARGRVERMAGDDSFTPSLRDQVLHEIDGVVAVGERYLEYVETVPAAAVDRDLFRNGFMGGAAVPGGAVADAPLQRTVAARQLLADGLSGLVRAARGEAGELPTAGDIYRELIVRLFTPAGYDPSGYRALDVDEQLYWLWRIREIEGTPDEDFENARLTIKLQIVGPKGVAVASNDSRFDELAAASVVLADSINFPEEGAANKPWIVEVLARPFPQVLAEPVALAREAAELMPGPDSSDPASPKLLAMGDTMFAAIEQAADDIDDPKRFRKAFRAAIDGTRPSGTS